MMRRSPKPFTVEIRGGRSKPLSPARVDQDQPRVDWPAAMLEEFRKVAAPEPVAQIVPEQPARRILPALDQPAPVIVTAAAVSEEDDEAVPEALPMPFAAVEEEPAPELESKPEPDVVETTASLPVRQSRFRHSRDEFARGERWKARLPKSVHKIRRKP